MKRSLLIIISVFLSYPAICQIPCVLCKSNRDYGMTGILWGDCNPIPADSLDLERLRVYYDYMYNGKTNMHSEWLLQAGSNTSCFLNANRYKADSIQRATQQRSSSRITKYIEGGDIFHFFDACYVSKDKCNFTCRFGLDDIMYEETLPVISWELQDSVANICGYECKGARGTFRGRTYFVFYTEDIPVSAGPWKLGGLPGLILHADVDDGKFVFHAKQVASNSGTPILWPKYPYVKVNRKQYEKMLDQLLQNYAVAYNSHLSRQPMVRVGTEPGYVPPDMSWVESLETE